MEKTARIFVVLALAIAGYWGWTQWSAPESAEVLRTSPVTRGTVEETVLASGVIEARELISVGAQTSGQIETLPVRLGQEVEAGDVIAQIDAQDQENALLQAEAELANIDAQISAMNASLRVAALDLDRQKELAANDLVAEEVIESAIAELHVLQAEVGALRAQQTNAKVNVTIATVALERTTVTAPISGTIVAIVVDEGQTVNATNSAPTIVKIADLDIMVVKTEISEADVVRVQEGQNVVFTILGAPEVDHAAVVREIEPAPSEIETSDTISTDSAVYYNGLLEVENPDHTLRIGMTTEVSIILARAEDVLTIPSAALRTAPDGSDMVELFDEETGTSRPQLVEVGLNDKISAEILSGLSEGDRVVTGSAAVAAPPSDDGGGMGDRLPRGF